MAETDLWFGTLTATVRVEDLPASRRVVAIELPADGQWRVCGAGTSNSSGVATLPITGLPTSRIYAVAIDDWGRPFVPGMTVVYGDVIRPTQFLGWMYQVTAPGVMPSTEPEWWNGMAGIPQPVGTAMMQAIRHYQPIAHGPVSDIEWEEKEFDPYWDNVVSLLHFEGDLIDESAGAPWTAFGPHAYAEGIFGYGLEFLGRAPINGIESPPVDFGNGDFTIEVFCLRSSENQGTIFECRADNSANTVLPLLDMNADGSLGLWVSAAYRIRTGANTLTTEIKHIALTRHSQVYNLWVNGTLLGSYADSSTLPTTTIKLSKNMRAPTGDWNFEGVFDELRITKGVARYTEGFTPPTAPFPNVGPPL